MDDAAAKRFRTSILQIHSQIGNESNASIFRDPVRKQDAPSYPNLILKPMDLKTLGRRVRDKQITSSAEFRRDVLLIFANAVMFNPPNSEVALAAHQMVRKAEELIHLHESAEI